MRLILFCFSLYIIALFIHKAKSQYESGESDIDDTAYEYLEQQNDPNGVGMISATAPPGRLPFTARDDEDHICILLLFDGIFDISYTTTTGQTTVARIPFQPNSAFSNGSCSESQTIDIYWRPWANNVTSEDFWILSVTFQKISEKKRIPAKEQNYEIKLIELLVVVDPGIFPNVSKSGDFYRLTAEINKLETPIGEYFSCQSSFKLVQTNNFTIQSNVLQVGAFLNVTNPSFQGKKSMCAADRPPVSHLVAILVGVVLTTLVTVVLVAYFIVRRHRNTYQQFN